MGNQRISEVKSEPNVISHLRNCASIGFNPLRVGPSDQLIKLGICLPLYLIFHDLSAFARGLLDFLLEQKNSEDIGTNMFTSGADLEEITEWESTKNLEETTEWESTKDLEESTEWESTKDLEESTEWESTKDLEEKTEWESTKALEEAFSTTATNRSGTNHQKILIYTQGRLDL